MKKRNAVKTDEQRAASKKRNKIITWIIAILVVAGAVAVILHLSNSGEDETAKIIDIRSYEGKEEAYVMENDKLRFELDWETTQFSITNKESGNVWYSNPVDAADDAIALASEKDKLKSTLFLTYSTQNGVDTLYNNYGYSIANKLYEIEQGDDFVKVKYSIGVVQKEFVIPPVIRASRMEELMANMTKTEATKVTDFYKKYDINNLGKKDNKEELVARFPILETEVIWVLRDTTKDNMKKKLEEYFIAAGYTVEEREEDKLLDTAESVSEKPAFNVSIIYRLDGPDFVVEVPYNEIEYKEDYPVYQLSVLPMFGAGSKSDNGYMLVPEGGGAVIDFNNGKTTLNGYYANIYGWDYAESRDSVVHETRAYYNAFGLARNEESFVCIIEQGAPYAFIQAEISGKNNSYNTVNASYSLLHRNQYDVGDRTTAAMFVYEKGLPDEKIVQRYRFVTSNDYTDMAMNYSDYLQTKYDGYFELNNDTTAPVTIEILGAADKIKQVLGIPVSKPLELTTYEEALQIVNELYNDGMQNMKVKYTGWMNGGIRQTMLNKAKTVSALGNKKALKKMVSEAAKLGITVYLDGVTNYAYQPKLTNGFFSFTDAAKAVSRERVKLYPYSKVTYGEDKKQDAYYLLRAPLVWEMADNLVEAAGDYQAGVSFRDYGDALSSDFNEDELITRQNSMEKQASQLKEYKDAGNSLMINVGNDYAVAYADTVTNMELNGSPYSIIDRMVPFYQMAIHGYVNYMGESLNLAQNFEEELLKSAEYGAGLSFTFMKETTFALQSTNYTEYFGADYDAWHDKAIEVYTRYNNELGGIFNQRMTDHKYESDLLTCTTYEDGTKVYVNYGYDDVTAADGTKVPARDYTVNK